MHDPHVHALVDMLTKSIHDLNFTPSEIRECAMLAAINYELRKPPQSLMVQNGHYRPTHAAENGEAPLPAGA
jgi:hypothetical protein